MEYELFAVSQNGNNTEVRCPSCGEVVSVSAQVNPGKTDQGKRTCPHCGRFRFWSPTVGSVRGQQVP